MFLVSSGKVWRDIKPAAVLELIHEDQNLVTGDLFKGPWHFYGKTMYFREGWLSLKHIPNPNLK